MNIKRARELIARQRDKVLLPGRKDETWTFETLSIIESIFGRQSVEYSFVAQFKFHIMSNGYDSNEVIKRRLDDNQNKIIAFLDNCINLVDVKGIYKPKQSNFLSDLKTAELLSYLCAVALVVFSVGFYLGGYFTKIDYKDLHDTNKILRDSLLLTKPFSKNAKKASDYNSESKNGNNY